MPPAVGFDVFGTLCNPNHLAPAFTPWSDQPLTLVQRWRHVQVEYLLRRSAMDRYVDFERLTAQALTTTLAEAHIHIPTATQRALCQQWRTLPLDPQALAAIHHLKQHGWRCFVWSNATSATLHDFCTLHELDQLLDGIVSVDGIKRYKPHPEVYHYFAQVAAAPRHDCWLLSRNAWDAIGAVHAGLHSLWIRDPHQPAESWEIAPDATVTDLATAATYLSLQVYSTQHGTS